MKYYIKKYQEPYEPLNKNYPDEVMEHWWLGDDKKFKEAVKNYDNYYGTILPEAEITASKTTPAKTSDWTSEHNVAEDNKKYEQAHQAESLKIASAVNRKMDDVGSKIGLGMTAAVGAGYLAPATMAGWSAFSAAYPLIATGVDGALTAHGVYNLFGENGVLKTYNHFKNGEVGKGILSGAVDALDLIGGISFFSKVKTIPNFITKTIRNGNQPLKNSIAIGGLKLTNAFESLTPSKGNKIIAKRLDDLYYRDRLIDEHLNFGENSNILVHGDPAATGVYTTSSGVGKGVATVENYPYFKNGKLHPTKDRYTDYRGDVQNLIFWGDGIPFFETRGKEFENILNLLNKPSDYKYFSTVNKERLMSNAWDFPTENPYRFIISEKPKNAIIRNSIGVSRAGKEIITNDIPIDVLQGFEYDPLTKTFNRVLYHTPIQGYKKYIPNSSEKTYLGLLERPSKLTEAERLGLPKGERHTYMGLEDLNLFKNQVNEFAKSNKYPTFDKVDFSLLELERFARDMINRHNSFYRGVLMPWKKGDLEIIYNKLGSNATNEEILQYVATHPKSNPGTMFITPYSTNGYGLQAIIQRPYKLGNNRLKWIEEGDFIIRNGNIERLLPNNELHIINPWNETGRPNSYINDELLVTQPMIFRGWANPDATQLSNNLKNFKQGGSIHIKEKNKGKFTESAKRAGKSVQEHARDVVNNPKATKLQKKRALFALNAKKFKH